MKAATTASGSRLIRDEGGINPFMADSVRGAFNLEWQPRAGNLSEDTRAGRAAR
jgi:hypothetical protein